MNIRCKPALAAAALLSCLIAAQAADTPASAAPKSVHGVALASLCDTCAVVSGVRTEKRKGHASGVGAVGGAVAGGVIGKQVGGGTLSTVGGAVIGGVAGNEIEKQVKKHTVWITTVHRRDGRVEHYEQGTDPGWKAGTVVHVDNGHLVRR